MRKICGLIIKFSIYGLVFLMPLFWLPWTTETFEFNKQYLLFFLVGLALISWLIKMIAFEKRFVLKRTPLDLWILVFMLVMVLSAIFSVDQISSWLGAYGRFSDSVIGLLCLCLLYFLLINNVSFAGSKKKKSPKIRPKTILSLFLASSFLVVLSAYFSIFGLWSRISGLPLIMGLRTFNLTSGSLQGLSIFLAVLISLLVGLVLQKAMAKPKKHKVSSFIQFLLFVSASILLLLIDFGPAWFCLAGAMTVLLVIAIWTRLFRERVNMLLLPILFLFISFAGVFNVLDKVMVQAPDFLVKPGGAALSQEVILDFQTASQAAWSAFKEYPVLGSGPGTYLADFVKFKPNEFNQTRFWNVRFDKAPSQILEMFSTTGLLGILSYFAALGVFLLIMLLFLWRVGRDSRASAKAEIGLKKPILKKGFSGKQAVKAPFLPLFVPWLALFIAQFVYLGNTVLAFSFWLFTGLAVIAWYKIQNKPSRKISFSFEKLPEVGLVVNVLLLVLGFTLIGLFYLAAGFYWADVKLNQAAETREQLVRNLEKAINLNKYQPAYCQALSQLYLVNAWNEANKPSEEQNIPLLQAYASGSLEQARKAVSLSRNSVSAWENLGAVYRDARGLVGGTLPFALDAFSRAAELDPNNPFFYRELCRINLIIQVEDQDWDRVISYCQKAVDLKQNYLDAHIQLGLAYEQKGDLEQARVRFENALEKLKGVSFERGSALAGAASEIYFQLGRIYFNLNQNENAMRMFEQSVIVMPNYANARYALALAYQVLERFEDALIQFRIINQMVPGNEEIEARIQVLEGIIQTSAVQ